MCIPKKQGSFYLVLVPSRTPSIIKYLVNKKDVLFNLTADAFVPFRDWNYLDVVRQLIGNEVTFLLCSPSLVIRSAVRMSNCWSFTAVFVFGTCWGPDFVTTQRCKIEQNEWVDPRPWSYWYPRGNSTISQWQMGWDIKQGSLHLNTWLGSVRFFSRFVWGSPVWTLHLAEPVLIRSFRKVLWALVCNWL